MQDIRWKQRFDNHLKAFQIVWKLFHSRRNLSREPSRRPRILFLAEQSMTGPRQMRDQAVTDSWVFGLLVGANTPSPSHKVPE